MKIDTLNSLVSRAILLVYTFPAIALPVIAFLTWSLYEAHQTIERMSHARPVMVVPGAIAGDYTAGLSEENLINEARYLTGLLTNFTRKNAKERLDELEGYADHKYQVEFQTIKSKLLKEVEERSQGRSFSETKGSAHLELQTDGSFKFTIRGDRTFFSGGLVYDEDVGEVELHFKLGSPSKKNKYGVFLLGIDVRSVSARR